MRSPIHCHILVAFADNYVHASLPKLFQFHVQLFDCLG